LSIWLCLKYIGEREKEVPLGIALQSEQQRNNIEYGKLQRNKSHL